MPRSRPATPQNDRRSRFGRPSTGLPVRHGKKAFEVINCRFRSSGCDVRLPRDKMELHLRNNTATHSLLLLGRIDAQERERRKLSARMLALEKSVFAITEFLSTLEQDGNFEKPTEKGVKNDMKKSTMKLSEIIRNLHSELERAKMTPDIKARQATFCGPPVSLGPLRTVQEVMNKLPPTHSLVAPVPVVPTAGLTGSSSGSTETDSKASTSGHTTSSDSDGSVHVEIQIHNPSSNGSLQPSPQQRREISYGWGEIEEKEEPPQEEVNPEERDITAETLAQMSEMHDSHYQKKLSPPPPNPVRSSRRAVKRPRRSYSFDNESPASSTRRTTPNKGSEGRSSTTSLRSTRSRRERSSGGNSTTSKSRGRRGFKLGIDQASFRAQTQQAARRVQQLMDEDGKLMSRKRKSRNRSLKQKFGLTAFEAPKKPKTAYNYYQIGVRESILKELIRENGGNLGSKEVQSQKIARVIGERWKAMPEHERQIFNNLAAKDKERYKRDLDDYVRLNKQLEQSRKLAAEKSENNVLPGA